MKQLSVKVVTVVKNKRAGRSKIFVGAQVEQNWERQRCNNKFDKMLKK